MSIDISAIIVNWNTKDLLLNCVQSIMQSSFIGAIEIIVVDNASFDGSVQAVKDKFPQTVIIQNKENEGFSKANNRGILAAHGRYICLINSDVVVHADTLQMMFTYMENDHLIGILGPKTMLTSGFLDRSFWKFPSLHGTFFRACGLNAVFPNIHFFNPNGAYNNIQDTITGVEVLAGSFWMISKNAVEKVGLLDEDFFFYGEDFDYCKRMKDSGFKVVYFSLVEIDHILHGSSNKKPSVFYCRQRKADLLYWRKHHGPLLTFIVLGIYIIHETTRFLLNVGRLIVSSNRSQTLIQVRKHGYCLVWLFTSKLPISLR